MITELTGATGSSAGQKNRTKQHKLLSIEAIVKLLD